jgi:hypothetical protein
VKEAIAGQKKRKDETPWKYNPNGGLIVNEYRP